MTPHRATPEQWVKLERRQLGGNDLVCAALELRAARRPKPPSLKEQGFEALKLLKQRTTDPNIIEPLTRALEALLE